MWAIFLSRKRPKRAPGGEALLDPRAVDAGLRSPGQALEAGTRRFMEATHLFSLAESLGGVESLINHPALMTHGSIPLETRLELGITDSLVRLSVGVEDVEDLKDDIRTALAAI